MENNTVILVIFLAFVLIYSAYAIVTYVLTAKSLHTIAQRRGIAHPWLAWIPVAKCWLLGSLSDQYKMRKYRYDPVLRKTLLIFGIVSETSSFLLNSISLYNNITFNNFSELGSLVFLLILALASVGIAIVAVVYIYKAYYDLYASCKPNLAVLFLVLHIVTPAGPFLTYACRNSDDGLPVQTEE